MDAVLGIINSVVGFAQHPELASMESLSAFGWTVDIILLFVMVVILRSGKKSDRLADRF